MWDVLAYIGAGLLVLNAAVVVRAIYWYRKDKPFNDRMRAAGHYADRETWLARWLD